MLELEAALEAVIVVNLGQVLGELYGGVEFIRDEKSITADGAEVVDAESRKPPVLGDLRDILHPVFRRDVAHVVPKGLQTAGVDTAETQSGLVDQRRREAVRPAQGGVARRGNLIALVKAAAVCDALERTWLQLGLVVIADPNKRGVLVAEVVVHTNIK